MNNETILKTLKENKSCVGQNNSCSKTNMSKEKRIEKAKKSVKTKRKNGYFNKINPNAKKYPIAIKLYQ